MTQHNTTLYTGVAQRKRAVKTPSSTFLPLVVRFEDGYGSHPRGRRIETYHRYLTFFLYFVFFILKKNMFLFLTHAHTQHTHYAFFSFLLYFDSSCLAIPSAYLLIRLRIVDYSFR